MGSQRVGHDSATNTHMVFPVVSYGCELYHQEGWAPKNWCFWTVKTLQNPLDCKEIQPVHPKGNQSWIFIGRADAEAEAPILWLLKSCFFRKDPEAGKDWRQEEKGTTEDEMVGWHYQLNRKKLEQALGYGEGQGGLACCSPWDCKRVEYNLVIKQQNFGT